ncbi:unnamed protein product [Paramecium sonneborni]|uniref:Uncharacterized protein n=1 Tax=Paramecium sonneborni TaxID=65129 RepID=A0A8S1RR56_9CILI|nr:unnamed protein product [Paramecium sonneborni]
MLIAENSFKKKIKIMILLYLLLVKRQNSNQKKRRKNLTQIRNQPKFQTQHCNGKLMSFLICSKDQSQSHFFQGRMVDKDIIQLSLSHQQGSGYLQKIEIQLSYNSRQAHSSLLLLVQVLIDYDGYEYKIRNLNIQLKKTQNFD